MSLPEALKAGGRSDGMRIITRRTTRRAIVGALLTLPLLTACGGSGFRPLYGSAGIGANVDERLAQVAVTPIPGRVGQRLRNELIFQSTGGGHSLPPQYRLEIAIRESVTSTLVQTDGNALGQIYSLDASFQLIRLADNSVALKGISYGRAGFERFDSIFANVRARQDAEDRAARTVGEELKTRLTAYLATPA
jgi:Predicted secreted (periplasmic) protein